MAADGDRSAAPGGTGRARSAPDAGAATAGIAPLPDGLTGAQAAGGAGPLAHGCAGGAEQPPTRVVLLGFMGAGKTTVGRLLAPLLGWRFLDMDAMLMARHGATVPMLFERFGEPRFRAWEAEAVAEALAEKDVVIALGGGALEHAGTLGRVFSDPGSFTVFLEAPLPVSLKRCGGRAGARFRPVLADPARVEQRYAERLPAYQRARLTLRTSDRTPPALARSIAGALRAGGKARAR